MLLCHRHYLGQQLFALPFPLLQVLDALENLRLDPGYVQVRPHGLLGRPHLELWRMRLTVQRPRSVLWFSPTASTL